MSDVEFQMLNLGYLIDLNTYIQLKHRKLLIVHYTLLHQSPARLFDYSLLFVINYQFVEHSIDKDFTFR